MRWIEQFDFFFFDFDGLLVNTEHLHAKAYDLIFEQYGFHLDWDFPTYCYYAHQSTAALRNAVYEKLPGLKEKESNWDVIKEQKINQYVELLDSSELHIIPGVERMIDYLQESKKGSCVVTNSPRKQIEILKEKLPLLQSIPYWVTREDYCYSKPAPDGYLVGIEKYTTPGQKLVGFEDSAKGIRSLMQTPITPVLIASNYPQGVSANPIYYRSFYELFEEG